MRGRKYILVLIMTLMFAFGILSILPATAQGTYVTVYVESHTGLVTPPAGPFPVYYFQIDIYIESVGLTAANGIKKWAMDVQFNPDVHDLTYAVVYGSSAGYAMYDWWDGHKRQVGQPILVGGTKDATTGYWDDIAEGFTNTAAGPPTSGLNDLFLGSGYLLVTLEFDCLSAQPALIDLIQFEYVLVDDSRHSAEVVVDGYYGQLPHRMSYQGSLLPPGDPTGTTWHELYPKYCNMWTLDGWTDNTDGSLTASDQISMVNATGWTYQFHVAKVTVTIHWTYKPDDVNPTGYAADSEPVELYNVEVGTDATTGEPEIRNPVGTTWHELYPEYCREFIITSHEDTDGDGMLDISEQFDFEYFGEGTIRWAHLDDITTDIILNQKGEPTPPVPEFPLGISLIMVIAAMIPVIYLWRKRSK